MQIDRYNAVCGALPHTTHVVQWGGSHVWKVGGKVFAIGSQASQGNLAVSFKCSDMAFDVLAKKKDFRRRAVDDTAHSRDTTHGHQLHRLCHRPRALGHPQSWTEWQQSDAPQSPSYGAANKVVQSF